MGKLIEATYPTIEDRVNRWEKLGMLNTVESNDSKKLVATALDAVSIHITHFNFMKMDKDTITCLIPVTARIFRDTNKDYTYDELIKSINNIIQDFTKKYDELKPNFTKPDDEAEFISSYCKNYSF